MLMSEGAISQRIDRLRAILPANSRFFATLKTENRTHHHWFADDDMILDIIQYNYLRNEAVQRTAMEDCNTLWAYLREIGLR